LERPVGFSANNPRCARHTPGETPIPQDGTTPSYPNSRSPVNSPVLLVPGKTTLSSPDEKCGLKGLAVLVNEFRHRGVDGGYPEILRDRQHCPRREHRLSCELRSCYCCHRWPHDFIPTIEPFACFCRKTPDHNPIRNLVPFARPNPCSRRIDGPAQVRSRIHRWTLPAI